MVLNQVATAGMHILLRLFTGFEPTRYDNNVWIKQRQDKTGYDYICTYVDDFLIVAKDAWYYMRKLQKINNKRPKATRTIFRSSIHRMSIQELDHYCQELHQRSN
jgi:hypothetical protein